MLEQIAFCYKSRVLSQFKQEVTLPEAMQQILGNYFRQMYVFRRSSK